MKCSTCIEVDSCKALCDRAQTAIRAPWSTSLREMTGIRVEAVASSCAHEPPPTDFPEFPILKQREREILKLFYVEGRSYRKIAQTVHVKQTAVQSIISRAKKKIAKDFSKVKRQEHGNRTDISNHIKPGPSAKDPQDGKTSLRKAG